MWTEEKLREQYLADLEGRSHIMFKWKSVKPFEGGLNIPTDIEGRDVWFISDTHFETLKCPECSPIVGIEAISSLFHKLIEECF